jgi:excisionase family DNA binding protein
MLETYKNSSENVPSRKVDDLIQRISVLKDVLCAAKEVLTLEEAAVFMGISRSTLYKMTHNNVIPFYRPNGKLIYFEKSELLAWMRKNRIISQEEVDERLKPYERLASDEIFGQKKLIRNLSAGNKQKVGIIAALFMTPKLVILDEPFNFLDPSSQNVLKHVLTNYAKENHATLLISSHNLAHTIDISSRIALLEKGRIIRDLPNEAGSAKTELENYFETEAEG